MADPRPDGEDNAGARLDRRSTTRTPGWVWVLGIVVGIALVTLLVVLHLTGTLGAGAHR
jgi:hypothetical protein